MDFCETQATALPMLAGKYREFSELYSKKLWHQLSEKLVAFLADASTRIDNSWQLLYSGFIKNFEGRLNQVLLASLVSTIGHSAADPAQGLALFQEVLQSRDRLGKEASHCLELDIVLVRLRLNQLQEAQIALDAAKERVSSFASSETVVFSKYYKASAEYRKVSCTCSCVDLLPRMLYVTARRHGKHLLHFLRKFCD